MYVGKVARVSELQQATLVQQSTPAWERLGFFSKYAQFIFSVLINLFKFFLSEWSVGSKFLSRF